MKINETIRIRRKALNLTQEQVADSLGVSAPAVNKWEKGNAYPDILLLPPLARLLKVDLNTLLSFQETLTQIEVESFTSDLAAAGQEDYRTAFELGMKKIEEYPACNLLIYNVAITLDGLLIMNKIEDKEQYRKKIEKLYQRISDCEDRKISDQANYMLVGRYMEREEYEEAETLLNRLPDRPFDKEHMQANLYRKKGNLSQAAEILELKLGEAAMEIQSTLYSLIELSMEEDNPGRAERFAELAEKTAEVYDLWQYTAWIAKFQLAAAKRDAGQCIEALKGMLHAMTSPWDMAASQLYLHVSTKPGGYALPQKTVSGFLAEIKDDEKLDFLRSNKAFEDLVTLYC